MTTQQPQQPVFNYPAPAPKTFGLSGTELRAKRAAKKAERAEAERTREIAALIERVEQAIKRPRWSGHEYVEYLANIRARMIEVRENELKYNWARERRSMNDFLNIICSNIRSRYAAMIEAARLESAGSAAKRKAKRDAKEAARRARFTQHQAA